jgi:inhibitor of cysteine peptidase
MPETVLTEEDDGTVIELKTDEELVIRLEENPSTGYTWEIHEEDDANLVLKDSSFSQPSDAAVGGGGVRTCRFEAQEPGTVTIEMEYRRQWEQANLSDRFKVTVEIHE